LWIRSNDTARGAAEHGRKHLDRSYKRSGEILDTCLWSAPAPSVILAAMDGRM